MRSIQGKREANGLLVQPALLTLHLFSAALLLCSVLGMAGVRSVAFADELAEAQAAVDAAQSALDAAEARMQEIAEEQEALQADIDALQVRIDTMAASALVAQEAVLEGRASLGRTAEYEYKSGNFESLIAVFLGSANLDELIRNLTYFDIVMQYQADEIAAQQQRKDEFDALVEELNQQKDEQEEKLSELEANRVEAQQLVDEASAQLKNAQDEQASRLEALRQQAAAFAAVQQAQNVALADNANTVGRSDGAWTSSPTSPNPDGESSATWMTGVASAYGGSSDPYTPNPGTTATGAVCNDWSMGVAVPMAMPSYRSYFGRTVEISYGGMTVFAVVNDCGYMGGGSRVLDLQPGVWKAFGFSTCNGWGLRTVSYRFL